MKKTILSILLFPLLALAENSFQYLHRDKTYKIVSTGGENYELYSIDPSGKKPPVKYYDGGNYSYSKEKLIGIFKMESSPKTPYYDVASANDITPQNLKKLTQQDFENKLNEISGKVVSTSSGTKTQIADDLTCEQITQCGEKEGVDNYSCIFKVMRADDKKLYAKTKCKLETMDKINDKAFAPLRDKCTPEATSQACEYRSSYDMYECLVDLKRKNLVSNACRDAVVASQTLFENLIAIKFPTTQTAANPSYGFGKARTVKGLTPAAKTATPAGL